MGDREKHFALIYNVVLITNKTFTKMSETFFRQQTLLACIIHSLPPFALYREVVKNKCLPKLSAAKRVL